MTTKRLIDIRLVLFALVAVACGVFAGSGSAAANGPDLVTTITAPSGVSVYQSGRWVVSVRNLGNRDATNVQLTIQLPQTATSPTRYLMGTLGTTSSSCVRSGLTLTCSLGTVGRRTLGTSTKSAWFDIALPYSTNPIVITANAPTTGDLAPADNQASATASLGTFATPVAAPRTTLNTHCTGTPALSSFVECVPGSTSSFTATLLPGSTPDSGTLTIAGSTAGGTWTVAGSSLTIVYTDGTSVEGTFVGEGVGGGCWEGKMTFASTTQYVAIYRTCLQ